jgi:hypothetical protein
VAVVKELITSWEPIYSKPLLMLKCFIGGSLVFSPSQNMEFVYPEPLLTPWQWAWFLIANAFFTFASAF